MAGFLPADAKAYLLAQLGGQGVFVGLAQAIPAGNDVTLANITECNTPGYARTAVTWAVNTAVDFDTDPIQTLNNIDVNFPSVTADMVPCPYAFITDQSVNSHINVPVLTKGSATSGGAFPVGTYFWVLTAINAKGETIASNEITATLTLNQQQAMTWATITGATGYRLYRGSVAGGENVLVANLGIVTSYSDTGTSVSAGPTPPGKNTAAVGRIYWVWTLAEPVAALSGKPIKAPANGLIIE